jgi:ABC-2 type transport system ATP-binding protein
MDLLQADQLTKNFDDFVAVSAVSFSVRQGEILGFLGPNGAGKTTTINMLTGLARPTSGRILYFGEDFTGRIKKAQHMMGVVPDESSLYPELTGFENLCFCAALYGVGKAEREKRAGELLETFGLANAAKRRFGGYSKGMKRRLTIAAGIIHRPPLLFLDEPTSGIDVASARQIRQLLAQLNKNGTTIFLTTHYIEEAERLSHRIAFIVGGRIVQTDTVENLLQPVRKKHLMQLAVSDSGSDANGKLAFAFPHLRFDNASPGEIRVEADAPISAGPLVRFLEEKGIEVTEARRLRPSLEEVFVRVTGIEVNAMKKEKEKAGGGGGL